jgi:predicted secreted protein with PEFG-CTERM motif
MKTYFFLSIVVAALFISTMTVFAQNQLLFVETSENSYEEGETIVVSGNVTSIIADTPVLLRIIYEGNFVEIAQVEVAQDGNYAHTILAQGPLWQKDGKYIVSVSYGSSTTIDTSFEFYSKGTLVDTTDVFEVDAGSYGTFDVDYTVRAATVKDMIVDSEIFALIVILETDDDGSITLELPRESIDAKAGELDDTFIILIDGVEVPYKEVTTNSESRTITIEFEQGDSDIEIIGTFVVPEFGNIVMIILVIGIISTILVSKKFRLPITKSC